MMPENDDVFNGYDKPLKTVENDKDDQLQDAADSGAEAENARENQRLQEASRAARLSFQLDAGEGEDESANNPDRKALSTTHGSEAIEENLSGTTNLTIEQLKKEGDPGGFAGEDGQSENRRDLV